MKGYKGFNKDLTCRDFKYEIGKTYEMKEEPILCERGFHFCKELEDVFSYYCLCKDNKFCEIEAYGDTFINDNKKYCTNKIKIIRELSLNEILDILDIKDKEIFTKCYNDVRFTEGQICAIRLGLEKGLDVSIYAKPEFNVHQMSYIIYGLEENLNANIYAKPEFNTDQMWCIHHGLKNGLDVSIYAKSEFDAYQMYSIYLGLRDDLDVSIYAKPEFNVKQMREIYYGLQDGFDVSTYAKLEFDWEQMHRMYLKLVEEKTKCLI